MWEYFNDRRYRQHRILMAIMVPTVLLALAGVGGLVYLQEKHQRLAAEESPPVPAPRTEGRTDRHAKSRTERNTGSNAGCRARRARQAHRKCGPCLPNRRP